MEALQEAWIDHPELSVSYQAVADLGTDPVDLGVLAGPEPEILATFADAFAAVEHGVPASEALAEAADTTDALLASYADAAAG
jgi:hypothetical protein